ncbi:MAG TPA: PAS domain-containing sensor histidine kinase [Candidatus Colwellbacteria bacterium]|nr:PAS domain-containing sensor histidine kinase [Candidatus Colwellbacteria bacterium]
MNKRSDQKLGKKGGGKISRRRFSVERMTEKSGLGDLYRKVFASVSDIVVVFDTDLKLLTMNPAGVKVVRSLGVKHVSVGKRLSEALPFVPKATEAEYRKLIKTGKSSVGEVIYRAGNVARIGYTKRIPIKDKGCVIGILTVIQNITELKKGELALQKNVRRFNAITSLAREMIWESDLPGTITYVSSASKKIMGYYPKEIIGEKLYSRLFFPDNHEETKKLIEGVFSKRKEFHLLKLSAKNKNGKPAVLEVNGTPFFDEEGKISGYIGTAVDVTERETYEENLKKFELAVENASDHIIITDPKGVILFANKAVSSTTGYSPKEIIGHRSSLWGKQMPPEFYENMWRKIRDEKEVYVGELTNKRKNGELYIAEIRISPVLDENGKIRFYVGIERDITEAKAIDRAKTEFVSLASHQLRTPLSIIDWYTESLLSGDKGVLTEAQKDYIDEIHKSNRRMVDLVESLLNATRIDMGRLVISPKPVSLPKIADIVLSELAPQIKEKEISVSKIYDDIPEIRLDPDLTRVIFQNLLSNAVKYTPKNGKISLKICRENGNIVIYVADTGIGIPEKQQSKIFDKLFRADNARIANPEGNGLGLYITKAIIEAAKGTIGFESKEGKGTTFVVTFPVSRAKKPQVKKIA